MRHTVALKYSEEYLEIERPSPLSDKQIEQTIQDVVSGKLDRDITDAVYDNFKKEALRWILGSQLNSIYGLDKFDRIDIINGCTQFIDNIYMQGPIQVLKNDYRYHQRLNIASIVEVGKLIPNIPLILALPFPNVGNLHPMLEEILNEAEKKNIDMHIDGAWYTCCRDINLNVSHSMIKSIGISLSKGLGLGWNRIGLRWSRQSQTDSITIMNDFRMNNRALSIIGLHFVRNFPSDYLWNKYGEIYYKVCKDFNLIPTKSIYLAQRGDQPVGVSPLIRYVAEQ